MSPFGLRNRVALPAAPSSTYDTDTQVSTISGAPLDAALLKSWGESPDVCSAVDTPASLAETWGNR